MQYRYLGKTGVRVSALGWGNYVSGTVSLSPYLSHFSDELSWEETYQIMVKLFCFGVNLFDTAEVV